jgi:hypothetical protein
MIKRTILAAAAALAFSVSAVGVSQAAPIPAAPATAKGFEILPATHRQGGVYWKHGHPYYKGYRGHRHRRHGYVFFGGFWFPNTAFSIVIVPQPRYRYRYVEPYPRYNRTINLTPKHFWWCGKQYRSYRKWDNTFQPYHGPRKQCHSPYMY